MDGGALSWA